MRFFFSSDKENSRYIDWSRSKPLLAFIAVACSGLAIVSGYGMAMWIGALYDDIIAVVPFLTFCECFHVL
jgi:hypothetical protein